jgi:hypothetical protein
MTNFAPYRYINHLHREIRRCHVILILRTLRSVTYTRKGSPPPPCLLWGTPTPPSNKQAVFSTLEHRGRFLCHRQSPHGVNRSFSEPLPGRFLQRWADQTVFQPTSDSITCSEKTCLGRLPASQTHDFNRIGRLLSRHNIRSVGLNTHPFQEGDTQFPETCERWFGAECCQIYNGKIGRAIDRSQAAPALRMLSNQTKWPWPKTALPWLARGLFNSMLMKAVQTSETSVNFYQSTRHNKPKQSHLYTRRRRTWNCIHNNSNCGCIFAYSSKTDPLNLECLFLVTRKRFQKGQKFRKTVLSSSTSEDGFRSSRTKQNRRAALRQKLFDSARRLK